MIVRLTRAASAAVALLCASTAAAQSPTSAPAQPALAPAAQPAPSPTPSPTTPGVSYGQPVGQQPASGQPSPPPTGYTPYQSGGSAYRQPSDPDLPSRPSGDRVSGGRGSLSVVDSSCSTAGVLPGTRRRLVALAAGEWAQWGFPTTDLTARDTLAPSGPDFQIVDPALNPAVNGRVYPRLLRLGAQEDDRMAVTAVGGYWAVTPGGSGMVSQQNRVWGASSDTAGWAQPWSAAFISWVACEGGLGDAQVFQRSDSHWNYIDQAIRARGGSGSAAYQAYDLGEAAVSPGDLLCFSNEPNPYRSVAERRAALGRGFASHCDVVVKLDPDRERIYLIGGNVAQAVTMTIARATRRAPGGPLVPMNDQVQPGSRRWFVHLRLQAPPVADNILDQTLPVRNLRVLAASQGLLTPTYPALSNPAAVPGVQPAPTGYPTPVPQPVAPATTPVTSAPVANPPVAAAAPVTSTPVPNPPGG